MKIEITPKEIADLVRALQSQPEVKVILDGHKINKDLASAIRDTYSKAKESMHDSMRSDG